MKIEASNVGRIAERIAMNELEARGFHIIDLAYMSKTSANVDFIASKAGNSYNIQVKGMTNNIKTSQTRWMVQYGYCNDEIVAGNITMFNTKNEFALKADIIILIGVNSPSHYKSVILPVEVAEKAAQINISGYYRKSKDNGEARKPNKVWTNLEPSRTPKKENDYKSLEQSVLASYVDQWDTLGGIIVI